MTHDLEPNNSTFQAATTPTESRARLKALIKETLELPKLRLVLVITDSMSDFAAIRQSVQQTSKDEFVFSLAESYEDGRELLLSTRYDVAILDMDVSSVETGFERFVGLLESHTIPFVVLSATDDDELATFVVKLGAQDFIVKSKRNYGLGLSRSLRYAVERKRAEQLARRALKLERQLLRDLLEHAPILMIRVDRSLSITDFNQQFMEFVDLDKDEILNKSVHELLPDLDGAAISNTISANIGYHQESLRITKVGNVRRHAHWQVFAWAVNNTFLDIQEAAILAVDISDRVNLEHQRDEFYAGLAHDIRNPLIGQQQVLNSILDGFIDIREAEMHEMLEVLKFSNQDTLFMLNNLLMQFGHNSNNMPAVQPNDIVDLSKMVNEQLNEMRCLIRHRAMTIDITAIDTIPLIRTDATALKRILLNLFHNALKFAPKKSTIRIELATKENKVVVAINNIGNPIAKEDIDRLFDRFYQTKTGSKYEGSYGLGLYLCKTIMEQLGGSIRCTSSAEDGTTFTITLPHEGTSTVPEF